jgi:AcrR family transcriptional regulator
MSGAAARRTPRPWGSLSREQIIEAALEIAREVGLDALSIRRLADRLNASRMALYRHITDKEALLDLLATAIAERGLRLPELADIGPWPDRLDRLAHAVRNQLNTYPGLADLVVTRGNRGLSGLQLAECLVNILYDAGLTAPDVARYYQAVIGVIIGSVHRELHSDLTNPERVGRMLDSVSKYPEEEFPALEKTAFRLRSVTPDEVFETELEILTAGVAAAAKKSASS